VNSEDNLSWSAEDPVKARKVILNEVKDPFGRRRRIGSVKLDASAPFDRLRASADRSLRSA